MEMQPILDVGCRPSGNFWYVISSSGTSPIARVGHASVAVSNDENCKAGIYVIGGANPDGPFCDVHRLDTMTFEWDKLTTRNEFIARYEHAAFTPIVKPNCVYIFGGAFQTANLNSIDVLDTDTSLWSTPCVSGTSPSPRTHHAAASVGNELYIFSGGQSQAVPVSDIQMHVFDAGSHQWRQPECQGTPPSPRHGHTMASVGTKIFVHGGMAETKFYDDLFVFNTETMTWSQPTVGGNIPIARAAHSSAVVGKRLYVFGGMSETGALNDLYVLNTDTNIWTLVECEGHPPAPRLAHTLCTMKIPIFHDADSSESVMKETQASPGTRSNSVNQHHSSGDISSPQLVSVLSPETYACDVTEKKQIRKRRSAVVCSYQTALMVLGGMDTQGTIYDDCLVFPVAES